MNPLLDKFNTPFETAPFDLINPEHYLPAIQEAIKKDPVTTTVISGQLFAQPITNGYQLVDSTPKIVLKIFKTSNPDLYTAKNDSVQGVLIKKNNEWIFEYYQNEKLVSEKLDIKF